VPSTPTTRFGLVTEADGDPLVSAPGRLRTLATAIDTNMAGYLSGTAASRPGAAVAGRLYRATDITGEVAMDSGSVWLPLGVPRVTSLPTTGLYDGQQVDYVADNTNGVLWRFRYNASGGTYKWECVGGGAMTAEILTQDTTTAGAYADLTNVGPSITVPLAGDYELTFSCEMNFGGTHQTFAAPKFGAATTLDADAVQMSATGIWITLARTIRRNVSAAGQVVKLQYKSNAVGGILRRNLQVRPIRAA
jgi:hypothetical protein